MKPIFLFLCFIITVIRGDEIDDLWSHYKNTFGSSLRGLDVLGLGDLGLGGLLNGLLDGLSSMRRIIFIQNIAKINKHNEGRPTYRMNITKFTIFSPEEFTLFNALETSQNKSGPGTILRASRRLPKSVDWRKKGKVTGIKDQGNCGSCWAFSTIAAVESLYAIKKKHKIDLSEQNLVDCVKGCHGCQGGSVSKSYQYMSKRGVAKEISYAYKAKDGSCVTKHPLIKSKNFKFLNASESNMKEAVAKIGPITASLCADLLQNYKSGIIDDPTCPQDSNNHGILIVGYGKKNGKEYWIIKNSYGTQWGEHGYFRLAYGKNMCGIQNEPAYPVF